MNVISINRSLDIPEIQAGKVSRAVDALNRNPWRVFLVISGLYFVITFSQSFIRLLWFDELITFYIARLNSAHAIWNALANGTDPNPPLTHLAVMWSMRILGENVFAARLPSIIASWIGIACLFVFLRRRVPVIYAVAGTLFFMSTAAFDYSYESRSYPFTLMFAMLSLLAWRWTIEGQHRIASAALLTAALAGGISSNYYAVLAFFPIAAGELVRSFYQRRIELRVWAALAVGGLPIFAYMPLINHAIARFSPYAWNRPHPDVIADSYTQMVDVILVIALITFLSAIVLWIVGRQTGKNILSPTVLPKHEAAAVLVNMMYPFIGYVIAVARAGMISPRFLIPMCYGFAIAVAVLAFRMLSRHRTAGFALMVLFLAWVISRESVVGYDWNEQREAFQRVQRNLPHADTIAVADSLLVLPLYYYSPRAVASRIVFPVDFEAIRLYKREDSPEQNLWAGRDSVFPIPIVALDELEQNAPNFLIVAPKDNWLLSDMTVQRQAARQLPIEPRAGNIGGFTPLCHGEPFFFEQGDAVDASLFASTRRKQPVADLAKQ